MHAEPDSSLPVTLVEEFALGLTAVLEPRGPTVTVRGDGTIDVRNPAGEAAATDPLGRLLNPGLNQRLTVVEDDRGPWVAWLWPGPTRDAPWEAEPMVPIGDLDEAARRITNVLRVDEPGRDTR